MKTLLLASTAAVFLAAGSATAADMAAPYSAPPPRPVISWSGPYLGVNVGYSWGKSESDWTATALGTTAVTSSPKMWTASSAASSRALTGRPEGGCTAWRWTSRHPARKATPPIPSWRELVNISVNADHKLKWFGTARSRLGFLWSEYVLVYATLGVAYGQLTSDYALNVGAVTVATLSFKDTRAGMDCWWGRGDGVWWRLERKARIPLHRPRQKPSYRHRPGGGSLDLGQSVPGSHRPRRSELSLGRATLTLLDLPRGRVVAIAVLCPAEHAGRQDHRVERARR